MISFGFRCVDVYDLSSEEFALAFLADGEEAFSLLLLLARCPNWLFCGYGTPCGLTKAATPFPLELASCLLRLLYGLCSSDKL